MAAEAMMPLAAAIWGGLLLVFAILNDWQDRSFAVAWAGIGAGGMTLGVVLLAVGLPEREVIVGVQLVMLLVLAGAYWWFRMRRRAAQGRRRDDTRS